MAGNLQVFIGAARDERLRRLAPEPLASCCGSCAVVLLAALVLHVLMAWQLTRMKRAARPVGYTRREPQVSTLASRTMRWGGVLLLVFIVFHILHFTTGRPCRPAGRTYPRSADATCTATSSARSDPGG